ncbi:hypothetical protein TNCV_3625031 [Trichonephila clavipes]|nr:hypothetical protein TNCV_3625031 [Trichonephila clavipes]
MCHPGSGLMLILSKSASNRVCQYEPFPRGGSNGYKYIFKHNIILIVDSECQKKKAKQPNPSRSLCLAIFKVGGNSRRLQWTSNKILSHLLRDFFREITVFGRYSDELGPLRQSIPEDYRIVPATELCPITVGCPVKKSALFRGIMEQDECAGVRRSCYGVKASMFTVTQLSSGSVAQMVERVLRMREMLGSIPRASN